MPVDPVLTISLGVALVGIFALAAVIGRRRRCRDPQRLFSHQQKHLLIARAGGRCEHKHPLWRRCQATTGLQADHVVPWSRGGMTRIHNGSALCRRHNRRKSAAMPTSLYRWRLNRRRRRYLK